MTQRARARHRTAVLGLLLLLPVGGSVGGTAATAAAPPANPSSAVAPSVTPTPEPAVTPAPRPAAAGKAQAPSVPTVRATLAPPARPAPVPVRFTAPEVGIDLPVQGYGVDDDGLMLLPETVNEVAWYAYSARPGDRSGTSVLAAHVDTVADGLGPFAALP